MQETKAAFNEQLFRFFDEHGRHNLPWRQPANDGWFDPYAILVSELMLQQTQVPRVIPKFGEFLRLFPSTKQLALAELGQVLRAWSGLGYNRRAKFLWQAAQAVEHDFAGTIPSDVESLVTLPGVGVNTAGAILAYAFNQPALFIETNVRTVFIHHFLADAEAVSDKQISQLVAAMIDREHPREWYWALMDYGSYLKQTVGNLNRASQTYTKQSAFHGSRRQIRGQVLKLLGSSPRLFTELQAEIHDERLPAVLDGLVVEGLISVNRNRYCL